MRQLQLNLPPGVTETDLLAALRSKRSEVRGKMYDPHVTNSVREEARATIERTRILEKALKYRIRSTAEIAEDIGCSVYVVRRAIQDFNERKLEALVPGRPGRKVDSENKGYILADLRLLREQFPEAGPMELGLLLHEHCHGPLLSRAQLFRYLREAKIHFRNRKRS